VVDSLQTNKDKDRRNVLVCNDLARKYRTKTNELETKHQQLNVLHTEFEQKVQQKEVLFFSRKKKEIINSYLGGRKSN
jgi:gluconate kinase